MKLSIVIEDGQIDKTGKKGRAIMAQLKTDIKGCENIWGANWLDNDSVLGKEIDDLIKGLIKQRKEEMKRKKVTKDVAEKATEKIIG